MKPRPALILTLLALACSACAGLPSAPNAEPARAGKLVSGAMERHADAIVIDWDKGHMQEVTLDRDRALTFINGKPGARHLLAVTQDATGSRTVTWPANVRWPGGTAPALTTTAGKTDYIAFIYNGARGTYDGVAISQDF